LGSSSTSGWLSKRRRADPLALVRHLPCLARRRRSWPAARAEVALASMATARPDLDPTGHASLVRGSVGHRCGVLADVGGGSMNPARHSGILANRGLRSIPGGRSDVTLALARASAPMAAPQSSMILVQPRWGPCSLR
jgi:hypothetical protein